MRKCYLFLMMLFVQLIAVNVSAQTDAEYEAALAAIDADGPKYYITTEVVGVEYYLTDTGELWEVDDEDPGYLFTFEKNSAGGFKQYGYKVHGSTYFSNPNSSDNINDASLHTNGDGRDTWEVQVFFLGENGKYAVRSTNCTPATSSWNWVGTAFWAVHVTTDADGNPEFPTAGYEFEPQYRWTLKPAPLKDRVTEAFNAIYNK